MMLKFPLFLVLVLFSATVAAAGTDDSTTCLCQKALAASMCRDASSFSLQEIKPDGARFSVRTEGGSVDYYCRRAGDELTLASPVWMRDTVTAKIVQSGGCPSVSIPKTKCESEPDVTCCP